MNRKKPKVVIDTNIIISGLLKSQVAGNLINALFAEKFKIIFSKNLFEEINQVIRYNKFKNLITNEESQILKDYLKLKAIWVKRKKKLDICRDPKDNIILETAKAGNVTYIVTGDKDLLILKKYQKIKIITLKEFLKIINHV